MKLKKRYAALVVALTFMASLVFFTLPAKAAFNSNLIVGDPLFDNSSTMSAAQIDAFLNAKGGCLSPNSGFSAIDPVGYSPSGGYQYGGNVSAGTVIAHAAQAYDLNPQVLIVTLQKEQSLITSTNCSTNTISKAVGYACPDGGSSYSYSGLNLYTRNGTTYTTADGICVNSSAKAGFTQQVIRAAWLFKFSQQRSLGNVGWAVIKGNWNNSDDPGTCYGGAMTAGYRKRCSNDAAAVYYDGYTTIDNTSTYMGSGATASLYRYTPHFSGNKNFYNIFASYFGDPNTPCLSTANVGGVNSGTKFLSYRLNDSLPTSLAYTIQNNTGSMCAEAHFFQNDYQAWIANVATAMKATNPTLGTLISLRSGASKSDGLAYLTYSGAGGRVEVHKFSTNMQTFPGYYDVATNLGGVSPTSGSFVSGDFLGYGTDQISYVHYNGTNGRVEVHVFDPTLQKAVGFYDVATNLSGVDASTGMFVSGDFLGRGTDQIAYVLYNGTGGRVEVHVFDPTLQKAVGFYDVATNLGGVNASTGTFVAGDFLNKGHDQLAYIAYTGAANKVESHIFSDDLTRATGTRDIPTLMGTYNPNQ
jgi:hypothetical protein